jgi:mannose-1-phosphate guanylyltransferase
MKIKALLLAAGYGKRLRPITYHTSKCLVKIKGRPLLDYWLEELETIPGIESIINTHWLSDEVGDFIFYSSRVVNIKTSYETSLLGSGGTLLKHRKWLMDSDLFLIIYADNYTNVSLKELIEQHISSNLDVTCCTFISSNPSSCGILELDESNNVIGFEEKPENPRSEVASAGIFAVTPDPFFSVVDQLKNVKDIAKDILPHLKMSTFPITGFFKDIGTLESYSSINQEDI